MQESAVLLILPTLQAAEQFESYVFYLGDAHAHTGLSGDGGSDDLGDCADTCGDLSEALNIARTNNLDWVVFPDHINGYPEAGGYPISIEDGYNEFFQVVAQANEPGVFITLPAAEVWFNLDDGLDDPILQGDPLGHKTLMFFGDNEALAGVTMAALQPNGISMEIASCDAIHDWATNLKEQFGPIITAPHHPAALQPMVTDWDCFSPEFEPVVEVYSEHGSSIWRSEIFDPLHNGFDPEHSVEAALDPDGYGLQLGFIGGTDSHDTNPGGVCSMDGQRINDGTAGGLTVAVLSEHQEFTREALYGAMQRHTTYVTTGPMVPMVVEWSSLGLGLGGLGDWVGLPEGQPLTLEIRIPSSLDAWVIAAQVVGPAGTHSLSQTSPGVWSITMDEAPVYLYPALVMDGTIVYPDGCDDGGNNALEWLWGSPSWIGAVPGDVDGDGFSWAEGDCVEGDATIGPEAVEIWYDGVDQNCDGNDTDRDGDGVEGGSAGLDCDDQNPLVNPSISEVWYDGVDQNCDGNDADQDGDGVVSERVGGGDCNDEDARIWPGAPDVWYDGLDFACDGELDQDGDGVVLNEDCDDQNAGITICQDMPSKSCQSGGRVWLLSGVLLLRRKRC